MGKDYRDPYNNFQATLIKDTGGLNKNKVVAPVLTLWIVQGR